MNLKSWRWNFAKHRFSSLKYSLLHYLTFRRMGWYVLACGTLLILNWVEYLTPSDMKMWLRVILQIQIAFAS